MNPLTQLNAITIVSIIVIFSITYFAMKRIYFDRYVDFMEARAAKISKGRAAGLEAESIVVKATAEAEEIVRCARVEADDIAAQTRTDIYELRERRRIAATTEAEKIVDDGRGRLEAVRDKERDLLEKELVANVWRIVSKLDGEIKRDTVEAVVRRNIAVVGAKAGGVNG
ncbi:MAG: ATP synthase F0 subunit B [Actinomycetota bacterium]